MSIYIYAPILYPGTRELQKALLAKRLVRHDGMHFLHKGTPMEFSPTDAIICWGAHAPPIGKVSILNANFKYPTMFHVNINGLRSIMNSVDCSVFVPSAVASTTYREALAALSLNGEWPKTRPASNVVGIPELNNYVTQYYRFASVEKPIVFKGEVLNKVDSGVARSAIDVMRQLSLDFGVVHFGCAGNETIVLLKIITAPVLDAQGVTLFSEHIQKWIKGLSEIKNMELLLE